VAHPDAQLQKGPQPSGPFCVAERSEDPPEGRPQAAQRHAFEKSHIIRSGGGLVFLNTRVTSTVFASPEDATEDCT